MPKSAKSRKNLKIMSSLLIIVLKLFEDPEGEDHKEGEKNSGLVAVLENKPAKAGKTQFSRVKILCRVNDSTKEMLLPR